MKRKPRHESERTRRRGLDRATEHLIQNRERLFLLEAGGTPERPIEVVSASVVEVMARSRRCPRCEGDLQVVEHGAITVSGVRLRDARLRCQRCGVERSLFFRIVGSGAN